MEFKKVESLVDINSRLNDEHYEIFTQSNFGKENWVLKSDKHNRLLSKLSSKPILGDIAIVNSGCFTGYDKAFFVDDDTIGKYELEEEIIKPIIMGKEPKKYNLQKPVKKCIYPYKMGSENQTELIEEDSFKAAYPKLLRILNSI
jgi:hypothetical protein